MKFADIPLEEKQAAFGELRRLKEQFAARGWFPGSNGNCSIRVGDFAPDVFHFAVNSVRKDESAHGSEDFLFVDAAGLPCETTKLKPCADTPVHAKIYRMTGCGAIFHVHTVFNYVLSDHYGDEGFVSAQGIELLEGFGVWKENKAIRIPIVPNISSISSVAKSISASVNPDVPGLLLRNHGMYVWGQNALEAKRHLETFEFIFEVLYRSLLLPEKK